MKSVTFPNGALTLVGNLHIPDGFREDGKSPAIVCVHPSGGVKEQTSGLYARRLSQEGFITLAYDAACQGESTGEPRHLENPSLRVEDVSAAVDYLTTLDDVDSARIGVLRTRWMSEDLFRRAASPSKDLHISPGGTHIGLYDQPALVDAALNKLMPFYKAHL